MRRSRRRPRGPRIFTIAEAAAYCSLSFGTFYRHVLFELDVPRAGRRYLITKPPLDAFLRTLESADGRRYPALVRLRRRAAAKGD